MQKYLDFRNEVDYTKLREVAKIIKDGGIVVFPTETVYGIGVNALNEEAVKRIYEIKERPANKPISLLVSNVDMINQVAKDITESEYALIKEFFPGPLTVVLKKKDIVPNIPIQSRSTVHAAFSSEIPLQYPLYSACVAYAVILLNDFIP